MPQVVLSILQTIYVPKLWAFLFMNMITQYACIAGVNRMTSVATSLTLNLVLNLRKFSSLLFSIVYFENDFGFGAKMGTALVFLGTLIYTRAGLKANHKQQQQVASKKAN
ncbi:hypothetical protein CU098_008476 [Rhizopus stolonifer]|uniref:UAA transporter n=2 Tax=Mucorineae TaxID=1344963 RepID=A0A367ITW8_RHIST|nr:hypothetical protein CU098_008476 [Rhizopus stolonifer]